MILVYGILWLGVVLWLFAAAYGFWFAWGAHDRGEEVEEMYDFMLMEEIRTDRMTRQSDHPHKPR